MAFCKFTALVCLFFYTVNGYAKPSIPPKQVQSETDTEILPTSYDAIIVGGGPAGLSAMSSLARVRRKTLLIDSGEYRNSMTRYNHDLIGSDGMAPSLFRSRAREQIVRYPTATLINGTVTSIRRINNGSSFITNVSSGQQYISRKVILATGIIDILPETPGVKEAWGRGMYWCAWCDSWEHRDQSIGIVAPFSSIMGNVLQISTMNKDIVAFVNGTDTPENRAMLDRASPGWQDHFARLGIVIKNETILAIERLQDGSVIKNDTTWEEYDMFLVKLEDGTQIQRDVFIMSFPNRQRSYFGAELGVELENERIRVDPKSMRAAPGVWGIGDANNDSSTNVPHALYTGKKAAVHVHIELAKEDAFKSPISKRSEADLFQDMDNGLEGLWSSIK